MLHSQSYHVHSVLVLDNDVNNNNNKGASPGIKQWGGHLRGGAVSVDRMAYGRGFPSPTGKEV